MNKLSEDIRQRVLVCDGAMGTLLYERGISFERGFEEVNLSNPALVQEIHAAYIEAGADIIETNTFGGNRYRLRQHGLENYLELINTAGVRLAHETAIRLSDKLQRPVYVAGSVGPLGKPVEPIGRIREKDAQEWYREQIRILAKGPMDVLLLETFSDLHEVRLALNAAREESDIPVIIQMSFTEDGKTLMGNKPKELAVFLDEPFVIAVGANCSVGPQILQDVLSRLHQVREGFFSVQPNAGLPRYIAGRYIYLASPEYFAGYVPFYIQHKARIIGGCCGTTPEHIRMIRNALDRLPSQEQETSCEVISVLSDDEDKELPESVSTAAVSSSLREKFQSGHFVISVEVDPPRGLDYEKILDGAVMCVRRGIDAINIADNPLAKAGMTPLTMASIIRQSVQIEMILHLSCRDRNILGLQSEMMSAYMLGIRNVLCITGDPPVVGDYPNATGVFDVDSIGLIQMISNLNRGLDLAGKPIGSRTNIFIACAVNPTAVDREKEFDRFEQKMDAGAGFAMTQVMYDLRALEVFAAKYKGRIPILLGLMPLKNARHADFMHYEIPDITIPDAVRERMRKAGDQGIETGIAIAREFLKEGRPMVDGVYIIPPFNQFTIAMTLLDGLL